MAKLIERPEALGDGTYRFSDLHCAPASPERKAKTLAEYVIYKQLQKEVDPTANIKVVADIVTRPVVVPDQDDFHYDKALRKHSLESLENPPTHYASAAECSLFVHAKDMYELLAKIRNFCESMSFMEQLLFVPDINYIFKKIRDDANILLDGGTI